MTKISNYELDETISGSDRVTGTDGATGQTKNYLVSELSTYISDQVESGSQGETGPAGPTGPQGSVGPQGPTGTTGPQGVAGTTGAATVGPQGIQGPAGPVGPVGLTWKGTWSAATAYILNDAVGYSGASYYRIIAGTTATAPNIDTTNWALLASQGAVGPQGPTGATGPTGSAGTQGIQGTTGATGSQGLTGPAGPTGPQGPQGIQGIQGPAGTVSITTGAVLAVTPPATVTLGFTHNTVSTSAAERAVTLPLGFTAGQEIIVMASNNAYDFNVLPPVGDTISRIGVSAGVSSMPVKANENYRFTKLSGTTWKAESIGASLSQVLGVGSAATNNSGRTLDLGDSSILVQGPSGHSVTILESTIGLFSPVSGDELTINTGSIDFVKGGNSAITISAVNGTTPRNILLPDASGTVALTSDIPTVTSGTWAASFTPVLNVASTSYFSVAYQKTGNIVCATIGFLVTVTAANTATTLTISLPVNRSGSSPIQVGSGTLKRNNSAAEFIPVYVESAATSTVKVQFYPTQNTDYYIGSITFQYGINV